MSVQWHVNDEEFVRLVDVHEAADRVKVFAPGSTGAFRYFEFEAEGVPVHVYGRPSRTHVSIVAVFSALDGSGVVEVPEEVQAA